MLLCVFVFAPQKPDDEHFRSFADHFDYRIADPVGDCLENHLDQEHGVMMAHAVRRERRTLWRPK
jgi:hypothetical protein